MRPSHSLLALSLSAFVPASCGEATSTTASGSGQLTVISGRPTAGSDVGASFELEASFVVAPTTCATTTIGACTVNPCYRASTPVVSGAPLPTVGQVKLVAPSIMPFSVEPQSDGIYPNQSVLGQVPWTTGGQRLTLQWAQFPGQAAQAGDQLTLTSPPYVALTTGSAFAAATTTLSRSQDLTLSWTCDSPPGATDELVFDVNAAVTQVYCQFAASAGTGAVPSAALVALEAGAGSYNVHSKQYESEKVAAPNGASWNLGFNIDATARASEGLAQGSVTIQ